MTPEFRTDLGISLSAWLFIGVSKIINLLPEFQLVAVFMAIVSTFVTIVVNLPKFVQIIKKLFK
jgi:hypothetical protein